MAVSVTPAASHADILLEITAQRRRRVAGEIEPLHAPGGAALQGAGRNAFCAAIEAARGNAIIAEIKMGSPKLGSLVGTFDPEAQAKIYAEHGAAALSVVVEPDFFFGSYELLERCKTVSGLPAIAKDFIVSSS